MSYMDNPEILKSRERTFGDRSVILVEEGDSCELHFKSGTMIHMATVNLEEALLSGLSQTTTDCITIPLKEGEVLTAKI